MSYFSSLHVKQGLSVVLLAFILSGCFESDKKSSAAAGAGMPPMPVTVYKVSPTNIPITLEYPATVKSVKQVQVTARVVGTLEEKFYTEGNFVKKDTPLYKIDPTRYKAVYDSAVASLGVAEASLKEATRNFERVEKLSKSNAISQKDFDTALSAYESAGANVKAAKATVANAKVDLDYTNVVATISGMTGLNSVDLGSYVGTSTTNSLLTTITQMDPVYVEFSFPDIEILKNRYILGNGSWKNVVAAKLPVSVKTPEGMVYEYNGTIDFFDSTIDSATASVKARATFKNPDYTLIPGMFVRISINGLTQENAFVVPQTALIQDTLGTYVYLNENGTVKKQTIKTGISTGDGFLIINNGLKANDEVITNNINKIAPGAKVAPTITNGAKG
ncbi:MAG: efflux RND transporter periplasmic adaptor subunit [Campylobacteraceae bacterium]